MLRRMDSQELTEWVAFAGLEPFGGDTPFIGHAITASTIANTNRPKGKKAYKFEDFMPEWKEPQTVEDQIAFATMLTLAMGGTVDIEDGE